MAVEFIELGHEERGEGYTHIARIQSSDLTVTAANTAQTFDALTTAKGYIVRGAALYLKTPFQKTTDAAFNTTTLSLGDANSATRYLNAVELNANGSYVPAAASSTSPYAVTAAGVIRITINSMTAKVLDDLNAGDVWLLLNLSRTDRLTNAVL